MTTFLAADPGFVDRLFAAAYGVLRDQGEAEDAVMDVLFNVWHKGTAHIRKDLRWYLLGAVNKRALTLLERQGRQVPHDTAEIARLLPTSPSPEAEALREMRRVAARRAVAKLDSREAEIVVGRANGLTQAELGTILGIKRERVAQIEAKAHARLRRLLRSWEDTE